ncbi:putative dimethylallylcistransferase [Medicago truncatula]|uniref:Putative dimethylallylcistransferase n=1 Tax=Medicago truncatula TaxID=3880 RepID=G7K6E9_MEDTR|nr:undecaprenyl pyrophosphate synthase [Medicago truncatula]RHN56468.1 putative dimethylallylcistransferase [Medicago truncatula]
MFSLRLPIALKNTLITNPAPSSHHHYSRYQSHRFPSQPMVVTKRGSGTTAAAPIPNTALEYEAEGRSSSPDEDLLLMPAELKEELMPKHVALIMDGNRRWAKMRGLPPVEGYVALVL